MHITYLFISPKLTEGNTISASTISVIMLLQLNFDGVRVTHIEVVTEKIAKNTLLTFWQQNDINLSKGMDFQPRGTVFARLTHLQHAPFTYRIQVIRIRHFKFLY